MDNLSPGVSRCLYKAKRLFLEGRLRHSYRKEILGKEPSARSKSDLAFIVMQMFRRVPFLKELPKQQKLELAKVVAHDEWSSPSEYVYRAGDVGTDFYVILTGLVAVMMPGSSEEDMQITTLRAGQWFGELALLAGGAQTRTAGIKTLVPSEFLKVTHDQYNSILKNLQQEHLLERITFMKHTPLFSHLSYDMTSELALVLVPRFVAKNSMVIKQGSEADEMYFILSGECRVIQSIQVDMEEARADEERLRDQQLGGGGEAAGEQAKSKVDRRDRIPNRRYSNDSDGPTGLDSAAAAEGSPGSSHFPVLRTSKSHSSRMLQEEDLASPSRTETAVVEVTTLRSPSHFGEVGILRGGVHGRTVIANSPSLLLVLTKWDIQRRLDSRTMAELHKSVDRYEEEETKRVRLIRELGWAKYKQHLVGDRLRQRTLGDDGADNKDGESLEHVLGIAPPRGLGGRRGTALGAEGMNPAVLAQFMEGGVPGRPNGTPFVRSSTSRLRRMTIQ